MVGLASVWLVCGCLWLWRGWEWRWVEVGGVGMVVEKGGEGGRWQWWSSSVVVVVVRGDELAG